MPSQPPSPETPGFDSFASAALRQTAARMEDDVKVLFALSLTATTDEDKDIRHACYMGAQALEREARAIRKRADTIQAWGTKAGVSHG